MSWAVAFALGWAACLASQAIGLWLLELSDERKRQDALCDGPHGDVAFVPANDFEPFHAVGDSA